MTVSNRPSGRAHDELRAIGIQRNYTRHAEGSVLVAFGDTRVLCAHEYTEANGRFARAAEPVNADRDQRLDEVRKQRARGEPSLPVSLASERACNPFLRTDAPAIRAAVAQRLGREPHDVVETFAELRRWKDGFRA